MILRIAQYAEKNRVAPASLTPDQKKLLEPEKERVLNAYGYLYDKKDAQGRQVFRQVECDGKTITPPALYFNLMDEAEKQLMPKPSKGK